ncbi:UDP-glucose 4-epimerase [Venturia nashicola]|uniref:UDP-glucose 4-epimerase n=1 Tax=Venturia nashicola TaxID=86259 RepID=A0A4Z1PB08_9PEZI|nr:UDP-glucose 4-epimerase [Venturia nashicola]TLD38508.1 UDP-glucose 4-epimerase [Venturia nashicola]
MDTLSSSTASSASLFGLHSGSTSTSDIANAPDSVGTPGTDTSILFDDITVESLDISDKSYILVVGGLGYIGSHTTLELLKEGHNVVVVDDLSNAFRNVLDRIQLLIDGYCQVNNKPVPELKFHEADYKSPAMRSILSTYASKSPALASPRPVLGHSSSKIKGVIHFAAFKSVEESINNPIPYYLNNVCGMVSFLSLLQEFGIMNFVFSSSATVYGSKANEGYPLREEHCVHEEEIYVDDQGVQQRAEPGVHGLTSPYGKTKWICETILADVAKSDPRWTITALRYFNPVGCHESGLLGEDPRQTPTNLVPIVVRVLTGANPVLKIFGTDYETTDGTAVRDFIHVVDLARGHIAALSATTEGRVKHTFRTYNLGTGTGHSVREIVKSIEKASSRTVPIQEVGRRPGDVGSCVAGIGRASNELGWASVKSLDDCTTDVWNFTAKSQLADPAASSCQVESRKMAGEWNW